MQFLADYCLVFPVFSWFVDGMTVCRLFGCGVAGLWMVWLVCGWFADGLVGLWVVWVVFGWFTVGLQQTKLFLLKKNRKASS